ncbi:uncharacterized protein LOC128395805 [Panonychus citri]|uniref:uncharacterized protein LOC128395805 n=1 Tax=Panonychus citri TaxID=50023 RepID=UPI002307670F|nr:uncharacterized protein LOC128395805 [Panonychus citri]
MEGDKVEIKETKGKKTTGSIVASIPVANLNNINALSYDYGEDLVDWFENYEFESDAAGWDDETKLTRLPMYLQGTARSWYACYASPSVKSRPKDYLTLKKMMVRDLCRSDYRTMLEQKIFDYRQEADQPVANYILKMKDLCRRYESEMNEKKIIRIAIRGMWPAISQHLDQFEMETVSDLLRRANVAENTYKRNQIVSNERQQLGWQQGFNDLKKQVELIGDKLSSVVNLLPKGTSNSSDRKSIICHYCNKPGHKKYQCLSRKRDEERKRKENETNYPSTSGYKNPNNNWSRPKVVSMVLRNSVLQNLFNSIDDNNLIFMKVKINDIDFSALVDTGSDVTIITREIVNRLHVSIESYQGPRTDTASNLPLKPSGQITLTFTLIDSHSEIIKIQSTVMVVDYLPAGIEILIGQDIARIASLEINCSNKTVVISRETNNGDDSSSDESLPDIWDSESDEEGQLTMVNVPRKEEQFNLDSGLEHIEKEKVQQLLIAHRNCFSFSGDKIGRTQMVKHQINTGDHPPIHQPPYRLSALKRELATKMIEELIDDGFVVPSNSPWASPIVMVDKKTGEKRFCVDYRRLNSVTKKDVYPLPDIQLALDCLQGAKYFTLLDLKSGYYQIAMDPFDQEKTAFITQDGLFEFVVMPFGLTCAPATFQRLMDGVISGLKYNCVLVYIDDVIIFSKTFEEHLIHLDLVLMRLSDASLTLKPSKCFIGKSEILYLGHKITKEGQYPDENKLTAIKNYPLPANLTDLRAFVALCSYFRRFIEGFAITAKPLTNLTRKEIGFNWGKEQDDAFQELKSKLTNPPLLVHYDPKLITQLRCDACHYGVGNIIKIAMLSRYPNELDIVENKLDDDERLFVFLNNQSNEADNQMRIAQDEDPHIRRLKTEIENRVTMNRKVLDKYKINEGILFRIVKKPYETSWNIVVPEKLRTQIIRANHDDILSGHIGFQRTYEKITAKYYWQKMVNHINDYVRRCAVCQLNNKGSAPLQAPLQAIAAARPFEKIGIDMVGRLPCSNRREYIIVATDYFTRWAETRAVNKQLASTIARFLIEQIMSRHGL